MLHDDNCTSSIKDISPGVNIELARDAGSNAIVLAQFRQFFGNFFCRAWNSPHHHISRVIFLKEYLFILRRVMYSSENE